MDVSEVDAVAERDAESERDDDNVDVCDSEVEILCDSEVEAEKVEESDSE